MLAQLMEPCSQLKKLTGWEGGKIEQLRVQSSIYSEAQNVSSTLDGFRIRRTSHLAMFSRMRALCHKTQSFGMIGSRMSRGRRRLLSFRLTRA